MITSSLQWTKVRWFTASEKRTLLVWTLHEFKLTAGSRYLWSSDFTTRHHHKTSQNVIGRDDIWSLCYITALRIKTVTWTKDCDMCLKGLQDLLRANWLSKVYNTNYKMLTDPKLKINNRKFLILKSIVPVKTQRNFLVDEFMMLTGFVVILKQDKPSFNVFHNYSITLKYQQLNSSRYFQAAFHNYL